MLGGVGSEREEGGVRGVMRTKERERERERDRK
jgi:hypothetical protein